MQDLPTFTAEKAKSLGLKFGSSRVVQLNTFGNTNPTEVTTSETIFYLKLIKARMCKHIAGQLTKCKIPLDNYNNVWKDLRLADELPKEGKVRCINWK